MYCPKCGTQNPDGGARCVNCSEPLPVVQQDGAANPDAVNAEQPNNGQYQQEPIHQGPVNNAPFTAYQWNEQPQMPRPSNFLAGNITMTVLSLCTCIGIIPGIIGIVFSAMVNTKYAAGDYQGAKSASTVAKVMFFVTLAFVIAGLIYWIFAFSLGMGAAMDYLNYYMEFPSDFY